MKKGSKIKLKSLKLIQRMTLRRIDDCGGSQAQDATHAQKGSRKLEAKEGYCASPVKHRCQLGKSGFGAIIGRKLGKNEVTCAWICETQVPTCGHRSSASAG
ncbi:hypothetical protein HAX54_028219, partial [Datura stramonium]|nr:hypothetical protein [Datura stramonium]